MATTPATVGAASPAAAAMSTTTMPAAAVAAASAFGGDPYALRSGVILVEDVKGRQADVGDFLVGEHHSCGLLCR
jgi:hypothetical protein